MMVEETMIVGMMIEGMMIGGIMIGDMKTRCPTTNGGRSSETMIAGQIMTGSPTEGFKMIGMRVVTMP